MHSNSFAICLCAIVDFVIHVSSLRSNRDFITCICITLVMCIPLGHYTSISIAAARLVLSRPAFLKDTVQALLGVSELHVSGYTMRNSLALVTVQNSAVKLLDLQSSGAIEDTKLLAPHLAVIAVDGSLRVVTLPTLNDKNAFAVGPAIATSTHEIRQIAVGSGASLAYGGMDGQVTLVQLGETGTNAAVSAVSSSSRSGEGVVSSVCFAPDPNLVSWTTDRGGLHFWDVRAGQRPSAVHKWSSAGQGLTGHAYHGARGLIAVGEDNVQVLDWRQLKVCTAVVECEKVSMLNVTVAVTQSASQLQR
jgi:WD40 repeat protein